jgi:hypothetical protein
MGSQMTTMRYYNCWVCGVPFSAPQALHDAIKRDDKILYCPRGCKLGLGESEADKLRRQLDDQQRATQRANNRLQHERRSHAATKGQLTKTKKRVANGVCPCCNRSFKNVQRHMKDEHPEYVREAESLTE